MKRLIALVSAFVLFSSLTGLAADNPWKEADRIVAKMSKVHFPKLTVSIVDYGAVPDNPDKICHDAINQAIIDVSVRGGGTVVIPDGTFYCGPLTLKSNVCLHLSDNAVLKFSTDPALYFPQVLTRWEGIDCYNIHPLIYAYGEKNIAITGKGTIDSQASRENWWAFPGMRSTLLEWNERQAPMSERITLRQTPQRPQFINLYRCTTVLIEDVTLISSPFWVIHPLMCKDLTVRGLTINNHGPNGDGCDPESCKNVLIENCTFNTGDDCIAIKSGRNADGRRWNIPSENIVVRGCTMADGHGGVVVGSEISGGFRNLYVEDCKMDSPNLDRVIRIKTSNARGGVVENVYVRNVEVGQCREAVLRINLDYENKEKATRGFNPTVRNVYMQNVTCKKSQYGLTLIGLNDSVNLYNINISNCRWDGVTSGGHSIRGKIGDVNITDTTLNGEPMHL